MGYFTSFRIIIGAAYPVGSMGIFTYMQNLNFMVNLSGKHTGPRNSMGIEEKITY